MANLPNSYALPLKIVSTRLNHMKTELTGVMKKIEQRAIYNQKMRKDHSDDIQLLLTWDDWIYAALDCNHELKQARIAKENEIARQTSVIEKMLNNYNNNLPFGKGIDKGKSANVSVYEQALQNIKGVKGSKPAWASNLKVGDHIPKELLDELPVTTGELVTLGNWMLTKNIYRFEDIVINEILKTGFDGVIPNYIINLPDLCIYIQTDNAKLMFEDNRVMGVLFCVTELCGQRVLVSTMYLDTGMPRTIVITLNEDLDIESSLGDFVDEFQQDYDPETMQDDLNVRIEIQKKLINLVLWFSQQKPEISPPIPEGTKPVQFTHVKKEKRLFEASKYKTYMIGTETAKEFTKIYQELEAAKNQAKGTGKRTPHLRRSHWHLYWYGKKGKNERYDFKLLPITMVGGITKS
ncbi:hypothetical protein PGJ85_018040 (plasmid) [Acinetobacter baumannii]|uniref:FinQ n=2 Tax=Acinetobacter nosocomialis TaxID=106654 RepID=A0AB37D0P6_ACINO|nr:MULTISPECIES: hypothetical protein [Acinetobacter]AMM30634.1 hypothetical protein AYJ52_19435 [Acinetobacter pittii]MBP1472551.1 hypothetical protein [Acinetobacter nosocomialis]MCJ9254621.1 hypothetical protein [Acinetobacter baumannii]MCJ9258701.1 hypothetical protein [Acinetobacter baumannii]MDA4917525.1 hypothetical protein [Acinetobacter baumannii]